MGFGLAGEANPSSVQTAPRRASIQPRPRNRARSCDPQLPAAPGHRLPAGLDAQRLPRRALAQGD